MTTGANAMMRLSLIVLLLVSCSGHKHHAAPRPTPFADIAGHYQATITARSGVYVQSTTSIGFVYDLTIYATGKVTMTDAAGSLSTYTITRLADKSFRTLDTPLFNLITTLYEHGTSPTDLSTLRLTAANPQGVLYGVEDLILVKMAGG